MIRFPLNLPLNNIAALEAVHTALTQYIENSDIDDEHDELAERQHASVEAAKRLQEWCDLVFIQDAE